jgi:hypothetical protein
VNVATPAHDLRTTIALVDVTNTDVATGVAPGTPWAP